MIGALSWLDTLTLTPKGHASLLVSANCSCDWVMGHLYCLHYTSDQSPFHFLAIYSFKDDVLSYLANIGK